MARGKGEPGRDAIPNLGDFANDAGEFAGGVDDSDGTIVINPETGERITSDGTAIPRDNPGAGDGTGSDQPGDSGASGGTSPTGRKPRRDRGQPRGPRGPRASKAVPPNLAGIEDFIFAIHLGMSGLFQSPELELDEDEAKKVQNGLSMLASHYNVMPTEKQKAWMNFVGAMGAVYGPRIVAIGARLRRAKQQNQPNNVVKLA